MPHTAIPTASGHDEIISYTAAYLQTLNAELEDLPDSEERSQKLKDIAIVTQAVADAAFRALIEERIELKLPGGVWFESDLDQSKNCHARALSAAIAAKAKTGQMPTLDAEQNILEAQNLLRRLKTKLQSNEDPSKYTILLEQTAVAAQAVADALFRSFEIKRKITGDAAFEAIKPTILSGIRAQERRVLNNARELRSKAQEERIKSSVASGSGV